MTSLGIFNNEPDVRHFKAGDIIFSENEPGDLMFALLEGQVRLLKGDRTLRTLEAGEVFGEMAIIEGKPRSANAVAVTNCSVAAISQKRFMTLVSQTPFFAIQMLRILSERLRQETDLAG